jgi:hypothetical protein
MATNYIKISNGKVLDECAFYEYLKTAKGFCCEKGWSWENETTEEVKTGREWLDYFNENPPSLCVPFFTFVVNKTGINDLELLVSGGEVFNIYVDFGDGVLVPYEGASEYTIYAGELEGGEHTIRVFVDSVGLVNVISNTTRDPEVIEFFFSTYPTGMMADYFPSLVLNGCNMPKSVIDDLLCYLSNGVISGANIDFTDNDPPYAPSPAASQCIILLTENANIVSY